MKAKLVLKSWFAKLFNLDYSKRVVKCKFYFFIIVQLRTNLTFFK